MVSNKAEIPSRVQVDMEKCLRVSKKVMDLLRRRTKNAAEAYFSVRLVGIFLEEKLGYNMTTEQEAELRKLWHKDQGTLEKNL